MTKGEIVGRVCHWCQPEEEKAELRRAEIEKVEMKPRRVEFLSPRIVKCLNYDAWSAKELD